MWTKVDGKKGEKGARRDGKKDGQYAFINHARLTCKGEKSEKSGGKKAR
jgi:hypothetical protein